MERHCKEYRKWENSPAKIQEGFYRVDCINAEKQNPKISGKENPIVALFHRVITEDGKREIIIQRLHIHKKFTDHMAYYKAWVAATGHRPDRRRIKEMPMSVFIGRSFLAKVEDHKPLRSDHDSRLLYAMEGITDPPCHCRHLEHEHTLAEGCLVCKSLQKKSCKKFILKLRPKEEAYWYSKVTLLKPLIIEEDEI